LINKSRQIIRNDHGRQHEIDFFLYEILLQFEGPALKNIDGPHVISVVPAIYKYLRKKINLKKIIIIEKTN